MKKIYIAVCMFICFNAFAFSIEEQWFSFNFEFGNYFEKESSRGNTYLGSPGFNINAFSFTNEKNIGVFFRFSFLYPAIEKNNKADYDYLIQYDWIVGPGFRRDISDKSSLHFGIGLEFMYPLSIIYTENSTEYYVYNINFGLGGDAGIKFDINDKIYIDIGLSFSYSFINFSALYSYSDDKKTTTTIYDDHITMKYTMIGVKPYIGIGFNYYRGESVWGKPKKE